MSVSCCSSGEDSNFFCCTNLLYNLRHHAFPSCLLKVPTSDTDLRVFETLRMVESLKFCLSRSTKTALVHGMLAVPFYFNGTPFSCFNHSPASRRTCSTCGCIVNCDSRCFIYMLVHIRNSLFHW